MKYLLLATLLLMGSYVIAEPPIHDYYPQRIQSPPPSPHSAQTAVDENHSKRKLR